MAGRRLAVAVAVGLVGLGAPAGAAAAGSTSDWGYVVSSASGSVAWHYSRAGEAGLDTVTFRGRGGRGTLHGNATYTDRTWQGCGPVSHTKSQSYPAPSFSVQGSFVLVTWRFPLPNQSYCDASAASIVARQLQVAMLTRKIPRSRFTCPGLALNLGGQARLAQGPITGTLTLKATVMLKRTTVGLALNL